jgi:hypothetical protein
MLLFEVLCSFAEGGSTGCLPAARATSWSVLRGRPKRGGGGNMRNKSSNLALALCFAIIATVGCERLTRPNVSGVWKGSIQSTDKRGHKWQGPAELTLNQNGDAITGTLVFTPPQADRIQVPISSGVVAKDSVTFSGQNKFQMASIELTFHGKVNGSTLNGAADMTSRSMILGPATEVATISLTKQ